MTRRITEWLEDDLKGGPADETVRFCLDGRAFEIDLSAANAEELRGLFQVYIDKGRRAERTRARRHARDGRDGRGRAAEMRAWARANGMKVTERGRVPADVVAAFEAANS
ncbi:MAG: Lsr2 family protein [Candidatus Nanopelagicales bacterium]|nr:Lsr2 family protein [Candidatus Nanopelagicales bacterium]MDZ4249439.1 Lsr2 family protein [Candidatus Nanopelagicales bacterium]MDZ7576826.1 Lsr2 family protein [Candidatus Nanopelagicales bacterium]